jgi:outer membrane protein OmpA-like peptidoglycan-associated protein
MQGGRFVKLVRSLAVLVAVALAQTAAAQSIELERLQLDPSGAGSLVVGTGIVEPRGSFRISAAGDWEHRPLVTAFGNLYGRRDGADIVENRQTLHLMVDYVLFDGFEVFARGNYILNQEGADGLEPRETNGFGMPSFGLRLGALRQGVDGAPMNLAAVAEFRPPWGTAGALGKFSQPSALFKLELGREFGNVVVGGELGILARETIRGIGTEPIGGEAVYGVAVAMRGAIRPELSFRGAVPLDSSGQPGYSELLAGIRATFGPAELFALGGPGFFNAIGTPEWRGVVGLAFGKLGAAAEEEAPAEPARAEPEPAPAPAPAPVDPCAPGQAHTPDQCPALDDDGDGIANGEDACPTEQGIPETKGCPAKDGDNDGVADHLDKCPDQAGAADNEGCPRVVVQPETKKIELREQVLFELGKSTIRPESGTLLDEIANVLKEHPEIKRVVVEGHTDSTGSMATNNRISAARAAAVVNALVERGVEKARMSAKGFGPSRPIASNDTPEGRDANRRVEISIAQSE